MELLVYLILCLIWGSTWAAIKIGLDDAPPILAAALRFLIAGFVLITYNRIRGLSYPTGIRTKIRIAIAGLPIYYFSYVFVYLGSEYIPSGLVSIIFATFPFFVVGLVLLLLKSEKIDIAAVGGIIVGFIGIVFIFARPVPIGQHALAGMMMVIAATFFSAFGTVYVKAHFSEVRVLPMMALQMSVSAVLMLVTAVLFEDIGALRLTAKSVGSVLYLALFGSIVTFGGYFWLLKRIRAVTISLIAFITPIIAVFLGYLLLGETLSTENYIGSALVLVGVLIVNLRRPNRRPHVPDTPASPSRPLQ